jgi:oligopeptide transport system substrate-binding protein
MYELGITAHRASGPVLLFDTLSCIEGDHRVKKRIALILASTMVVTAFLAGCSTKTAAPTPPTTKPVEKQEVSINLGTEPPNLDSAQTTDTASFDILGNVQEGLVRIGENFKILPGIAATWVISPDGLNYTFNLRKDAKWSDGKPITSKDFKFAWLRALDPKTASAYNFQLEYIKGAHDYDSIDVKAANYDTLAAAAKAKVSIDATDDYILKVTLDSPTSYWLGLMAFPTYLAQREDIVKQFGDKYAAEAANMLFNGPFTIKEWVHEDHITLNKNPNYWDAANVKLDTATFRMVKDSNTVVQMYEAGELDRADLQGEFIPKYQADAGFHSMAGVSTSYLTLNVENKTYQNANLRKALNLAIDRKSFADAVLKNGSIPAEGFVPPSLAGGATGKSFREISGKLINVAGDKAEAKKAWDAALKELGITKLTIKLLSSDSTSTKRYVQGIQEMLQTTLPGLTIEAEPVAFAVRLDRSRKGQFEMVYSGWNGDYNDPMTFMNMFVTKGPYNDARWSNTAFDALIKTAEKSGDDNVRMKAMADAEKIFMTETPILPLYHPTTVWVLRPYVKGILSFPIGSEYDLKGAYIEGKTK